MKLQHLGLLTAVITLSNLAVCEDVAATNGYFAHGLGTKSKGMGGVGAALALDSMAPATNPAAVAVLGDRRDLGIALFNPPREFTADPNAFPAIPAGTYESENDLFPIPHFGRSWALDEDSAIGLTVAVNGMGTKYNLAAFQNFAAPGVASSPTGVNFMQLQLGVSYGRKLAEGHFIGVTPILGIQRFMARGLEPFQPLSVSPGDVTNNGHDYSYGLGARLGWLGQITENFALGASYQTKIHQSEFDDYKGLFAGGDMDIPANYTVGLAFTPSPGLTLALDYQRIRYEDVKSISNPNNYPLAPNSLGSKNGIGFGWKDSKIVKLGVEWKYRSDLILRGGFSMANQVIPKDQALFNMLAPATVRKHLTLGFTKKLDKHNEINVSFMHAFKEKVSGSNPNVGSQTGSLEMEQNEIEISWGKVF